MEVVPGWIHHDSRTVRWIRFFSSHWLGSILFRQAVYYILFSALSFVASRVCRWVLQSPFKILRLGSPRQKSLECSKMEKGLEKIAAELHGVNVALSTRQNEIQAPIPEKILFFKLPLCEVIFRPAVLVWTIVRAFGHLLYTIVDCTMELLFWPPELFWTFLKFGMALVFLPFRALFWVLGLGVQQCLRSQPTRATKGASHSSSPPAPPEEPTRTSAPVPQPAPRPSLPTTVSQQTTSLQYNAPVQNLTNVVLIPEDFRSRSRLVSVLAPQIRLTEAFKGQDIYDSVLKSANSSVWADYQNYLDCQKTVAHFSKPNAFLRWLLSWNIDNDQLTRLIEDQKNEALAMTTVASSYIEVLNVLRQLDQLPFIHFRFQEVFWELTTRGALSHPEIAAALQEVFKKSPHYFTFFAALDKNFWNLSPELPGKPPWDPKRSHYIRNGQFENKNRRGKFIRAAPRATLTAAAATSPMERSIKTPSSYFSTVVIEPDHYKSVAFWDQGAVHSFISRALLDKLHIVPHLVGPPQAYRVMGSGQRQLKQEKVTLTFSIPGLDQNCTFDFVVFDSHIAPLVLGEDFWCAFRVLVMPGNHFTLDGHNIPTLAAATFVVDSKMNEVSTLEQSGASSSFTEMIAKFKANPPIMTLPPVREEDYRIEIKSDSRRARNRPLPRYSLAASDFLCTEVKRLLSLGFIEPSFERDFVVPQLVPKKTGSYRIVFDFRPVNEITESMPTSLASFRSLMPGLSEAKYFTSLDLQSGYHQLRIHNDTKKYTTFNTPIGKFQWRVLPFGLCDAPQVFGSYMTELLREHADFCRVYLDDILIFSPDADTHQLHVRTILDILTKAQHQVNWDKCDFHKTSIEWVGHEISAAGIAPTDTFKGQVQELGIPQTKTDIKTFLGHVGYLQDMIPSFGHRARPLTDLLALHARFKWDETAQTAFEDLKTAVTDIFPVQSFDPFAPIQVHTDASHFAASAVLLQPSRQDPTKWYPIEYRSKKFDKHQRNWDIHLKEFWAVKFACQKFRFYLEGRFFTLYSDQKSISQIFAQYDTDVKTSEPLDPRLQRWMLSVLHYRFRVLFFAGEKNLLADHLSRNPQLSLELPNTAAAMVAITSEDSWERNLQGAYNTDPYFAPVYAEHSEAKVSDGASDFHIDQDSGLLYFQDRLCIPKDVLPELLHQTHSSPLAGHPGIRRWLQSLRAKYFFPDMQRIVTHYVLGCDICQRVKYDASKPAGLLQPSIPALGRWTDIATDLVTGLPTVTVNNQEVDAILTIVCKFSNRTHFYAVSSKFSTQDFMDLFFERYVPLHGIPRSIQTDRGPQFTSAAFQSFARLLKVESRLSIARHQQSDGRVENRNKLIETYLRLHVEKNTDWPRFLSMGEFVLNSQVSTSLGKSPFEVDLLYQPLPPAAFMFPSVEDAESRQAEDITERMDRIHTAALAAHQGAFESAKVYFDNRRSDVQFEPGEEVYVNCSDLQHSPDAHNVDLPRKLRTKYSGPYTINQVLGPVNYELAMPSTFKGHPVFHVSLLRLKKTVPDHYFTPENVEVPLKKYKDGSTLVEVVEIVGHMKKGRGFQLVARLRPSAEFPAGEIHEFRAKELATTSSELVAAYARKKKLTKILAYCDAKDTGSTKL
ncbi:Integrase core domain-containing protein [Metschnikowia aff. pulcherrima]|uniref:RNA-directed DNA polymerase n=1 Tax=Metschnikowia aff. pulcherrima TaxID=2163413 RepID=A0A4P6XNY8_9ASCO|nr:Integrase core domain-containing protein [Metschnikowia aff. pulcherrima]